MLLIYVLICGAFMAGWILRGVIALRDVEEISRLEARVSELEAATWARRQGLTR